MRISPWSVLKLSLIFYFCMPGEIVRGLARTLNLGRSARCRCVFIEPGAMRLPAWG